MVFHVPDVNLARDAVAADNLEELPVLLIAVPSIEVDKGLCGAKSNHFVFFVECDTQDV